MTNLLLILTGVLLNAAAQLVLKKGMSQIGTIQVDINAILTMILKVSTNLYVWTGLLFYVISFIVWLMVLSRVEVSYAYPFLSIGYIIAAFVGYFYFGESMTLQKNWWNSYYLHWCNFCYIVLNYSRALRKLKY